MGCPSQHFEVMSTTNPQVETLSTGADKLKLSVAALLLVGGLFAFYSLSAQDMWVRVLVLLGLLAAAVGTFFFSEPGRQLIAYGQESIREARKVVWPEPKEAGQMTLYVFIFVVLMALFLWLTDKTLEWVLYDLVLGWKH